ncbi:MuDR family transposase [Rhynchospora pubera]|uniref:MuDR family transposase n=1 Tax=Rhynchospora pubera TaxID=906938 RepID=A0AAV8CF16_9POAL|nr:MuDR family transposase [Rhynchospora pubera]
MFEAAAWAFGPCIAAVPYIRPVISIDASFLSGRYKGKFLAACGYDPEQRLVPLAFALVRTEDEACWGWFMKFLREQVVGPKKFCVVSDRYWGIRNMFKRPQYGWQESVEPALAVHRYCMQHLCENVYKVSGKDKGIPHKFRNKLANKKKKRAFMKMWDELRVTNPEAIDYLKKCGKENKTDTNERMRPERWAQTFDTGARWSLMTSNGSESLNSRYKVERRLPVVGLVEGTWYKNVQWFNERKQIALGRQADGERWPKEVQLKVMKHTLKAALMTVVTIDIERGEFEVQVPNEKDFPGRTWKYKVLINRNYQPEDPQLPTRRVTCKCQKPQLTGIPCAHVVAICGTYRWEVDEFIDPLYSTENMVKIWLSSDFHCYEDEGNWPRYDGPVVFPDKNMINRGRRKKDRDWMGHQLQGTVKEHRVAEHKPEYVVEFYVLAQE